jgi:hypothetical protein
MAVTFGMPSARYYRQQTNLVLGESQVLAAPLRRCLRNVLAHDLIRRKRELLTVGSLLAVWFARSKPPVQKFAFQAATQRHRRKV